MIEIRKGDTVIFGTDVALDDHTRANVEKALKRILDDHGVDAVVFDGLTVQAVIKSESNNGKPMPNDIHEPITIKY